jgi:hypothetical protein
VSRSTTSSRRLASVSPSAIASRWLIAGIAPTSVTVFSLLDCYNTTRPFAVEHTVKCPARTDTGTRLHGDSPPIAWLRFKPGSDRSGLRPWCRPCIRDYAGQVRGLATIIAEFHSIPVTEQLGTSIREAWQAAQARVLTYTED